MSKKLLHFATAAAVATGIAVGTTITAAPITASSVSADASREIAGLPNSFADLVEQVRPAVVNISVTTSVSAKTSPGSPFGNDPQMEEFYKRFFGDRAPDSRNPRGRKAQAVGSGFIIDAEGYVVTNHHVIDKATEVTVILEDGTELEAEVKGSDPKTDLALLKVESEESLPYVDFGDSESARVGDWVIAIGNPFGLGGTTTTGIISARGRDINSGPLDDFIQVDAAINRGNSGGPLFSTSGRVIGVNTAIYSPNGGSVGIGFAVPSDQANRIIAQLKDTGEVTRGWLGVQIQSITKDIANSLDLDSTRGALVADVVKGSPAESGGIKTGDVIVDFGGTEIDKMRNLPKAVARALPGESFPVIVLRDGKSITLDITLEKSKDEPALAAVSEPAKGELGLTLSDLNDDVRERFRIESDTTGVVVLDVDRNGKAAEKGIRPGDVIVSVGNESITDTQELKRGISAARDANRKSVLLRIAREGRERFVAVPVA